MTTRARALILLLFLLGAAPALPASGAGVEDLEERLRALRGRDAMAYFELGEEVAVESADRGGARLARELFVLAYEIDRSESQGAGRLGRSVCLALADLSRSAEERRWLLAMAEALDDRGGPASWPRAAERRRSDRVDARLAEGLSLYRAGDFNRARRILERRVAEERVASLPPDARRVIARVLRDIEQRLPLQEEQVRRVVRDEGRDRLKLSEASGGDPGPRLEPDGLLSIVALEARLLGQPVETWSATLAQRGGEPLLDVDPRELAAWFGVDPEAWLYRDGRWIREEPEDASAAPAEEAPRIDRPASRS